MKKLLRMLLFSFLGFVALMIVLVVLVIAIPEGESTESTSPSATGTNNTAPENTPTPGFWIPVTAHDILTVYESNEIAGQQQFADRPLEITGRIGRPDYAAFSNEKRYSVPLYGDDLFTLVSLECEMAVNDTHTAWIATLAAGDTVTVQGYIRDNMTLGSLDLEECTPAGL